MFNAPAFNQDPSKMFEERQKQVEAMRKQMEEQRKAAMANMPKMPGMADMDKMMEERMKEAEAFRKQMDERRAAQKKAFDDYVAKMKEQRQAFMAK